MNFRQRRGQAFETMMLVISVIVALAILGVLLNILGGVGGLFNPSNPVDSIKKELLRIGGTFSPGEAAVQVKLEKERRITTRQVTEGNPSILATDLKFVVQESLTDVVEFGEDFIQANQPVDAIIVACGGGADNQYAVAFGRKGREAEVSDACRGAVGQ